MLAKLRDIQRDNNWTDQQMAAELGVARSTWTELKNGRLPLTARVELAAARRFPELWDDVHGTVSTGSQTPASAA